MGLNALIQDQLIDSHFLPLRDISERKGVINVILEIFNQNYFKRL